MPLDDTGFADAPSREATPATFTDMVNLAAAGFRRDLDREAWPRGLPWLRPVRPGQLDLHRIHCFALDRLDELLILLLPEGVEGTTEAGALVWIGRPPDQAETVAVCLFTGRWDRPELGRGGGDLISLVADLFDITQLDAARHLAAWCGISGCRHV